VIDRRSFIASLAGTGAVLLAPPLAAEAQQARKAIRIGMISSASPAVGGRFFDAFQKGMRELGYMDGQNIEYVLGYAEGRNERIESLAREYVERKVDLIVTGNSAATAIAQNATRTIPILMVAADPIDFGLIASLARPGGNITGLSSQFEDTFLKMIQLLREVVPKTKRFGILWGDSKLAESKWKPRLDNAATRMGIDLVYVDAKRPEQLKDARHAFAVAKVQAIAVPPFANFLGMVPEVDDLVYQTRLPSVFGHREFLRSGGLLSFGPDIVDLFYRLALYAHKVIRGENPAQIPVQQPTKFELIINLKTAKALGLTIPPALLGRADEVIE
jgi:putative tryptophan/tyrosine transport system substrate-binding protein